MNYLIYDKTNGKPLRCLDIPEEVLSYQIQKNEDYLIGDYDLLNCYVDVESKTICELTNKPSDFHEFNYENKTWELDEQKLINEILIKRQSELYKSDWTDTLSAQTRLTNWQQWQDYRQALRDIPQQAGYPLDVIWPEQPK